MKRILLAACAAIGLLAPAAHAQMVNAQTGTTYTFVNADCDPQGRKVVTFSNAASVAVTLPRAGGSGQFIGGCIIQVVNLGAGTVTITPTTSTISGAATLALPQLASASIYNDSTPAAVGNYIAATGLNSQAATSAASLTGTAAPFPITGLAAAQGGAVTVTGGASSTSANAGGAASITGGAGGATGAGGAASVVGAVGTSTGAGGAAALTAGASGSGATGNGGAASVTAGAAASVNGTGGATSVVGGAGTGTGNGGAVTETGGAGGTTSGVGGAMTIAAGAGGGSGAGGVASVAGGLGGSTNANGGVASTTGGAGNGTGTGGVGKVVGGASGGGATGTGGAAQVTGGAAASSNGAGGNVTVAGGASTGTGAGSSITLTPGAVSTGASGGVFSRGLQVVKQGTVTSLTTSVTLTAAQLLTTILTANQGGAASAAYQLPLATDLETALPGDFGNNDAFTFSLINVSTTAAETTAITTNTGWTLVGDMDVLANSASSTKSAGRFMVRRTSSGNYTLYRIS